MEIDVYGSSLWVVVVRAMVVNGIDVWANCVLGSVGSWSVLE